jgi:hypothetical protein
MAARARGHSIPRARGADFPPPSSPAAAKPSMLAGSGRLLLPGSKPLRMVSVGIWSLAAREPASGCPSKSSGKIPDTHSVGSICDHDFGVFTVTNIATENTDAVPPAHPVPRMPKAANQGSRRCRGPRVPLTCLAPLAAWQSLCTGHVDASLENSVALAFIDGDCTAAIADTSVSPASVRSPL